MKRAVVIALALLSVACASVVLINRCPGSPNRPILKRGETCPQDKPPPAPEEETK